MATVNIPAYNATALAATATIKNGQDGVIASIIIVSATTGTVNITDGNGNVILPTTASLTVSTPLELDMSAAFLGGAVVTITGTVSMTVLWV